MIEFKGVSKSFSERTLFNDFNLLINQGEKVLLSSKSGGGKTTLINLMLGFLKPDSGVILFKGMKYSVKTLRDVRASISYVSQDVDLDEQNVRNLIQEILSYKVNSHIKYNQDDVVKYLRLLDLDDDTLNKNIKELSGGERQRVGLMIAFLLDREIMILDEVTSGLDNNLKEKIVNLVLKSNKTAIIISHDDIWKKQGIVEVSW